MNKRLEKKLQEEMRSKHEDLDIYSTIRNGAEMFVLRLGRIAADATIKSAAVVSFDEMLWRCFSEGTINNPWSRAAETDDCFVRAKAVIYHIAQDEPGQSPEDLKMHRVIYAIRLLTDVEERNRVRYYEAESKVEALEKKLAESEARFKEVKDVAVKAAQAGSDALTASAILKKVAPALKGHPDALGHITNLLLKEL